ncbi:MAG: hypothetical protein Q4D02_07895 [Clostridia bacterium]|nr:hypothetical protein [Clostridia bacterium]
MVKNVKNLSYWSDKIFIENVRLLEELQCIEKGMKYQSLIKELRKDLMVNVGYIMYTLASVSEDSLGFFDENGVINIYKWNLYFELAIEIKLKILIPRNITINEYISSIE